MYAMDWRHYMPDIGRFTGMDALSDVYENQSPYHFALNNPANFSDPTGLYSRDSNGNISTSNQDEIRSLMGYFGGGGTVNGVDKFISGNSNFAIDIPEVVMNGRGNSNTWNNSQNYGYNSLLMYSKIDQARRDWNIGQARSTLYDAYENTKIGQEIGAFEKFLFLDVPLTFAEGEFLVLGWRAIGGSKYLGKGWNYLVSRFTTKGGTNLVLRPDIILSGGRSGQLVKNLTGPANSVLKGSGNRIFITDDAGRVIWDITKDRAKSVIPGKGFGPKVAPTQKQLDLLNKIWGN